MDIRRYETVVGYDVRVMWLPKEVLWSPKRSERFLWRSDTTQVFSTDEMVWPRLLHGRVCGPEGDITWEGPSEPEGWIGPNSPYWARLADLEAYLVRHKELLPGLVWLVAISCIADPTVMPRCQYGPHLGDAQPVTIDEKWGFLGYDVSDGATLSGLTNCGKTSPETSLRWETDLNDYHLFQSIDVADGFRQYIDERVPEHRPFVLCGLYKISELHPSSSS